MTGCCSDRRDDAPRRGARHVIALAGLLLALGGCWRLWTTAPTPGARPWFASLPFAHASLHQLDTAAAFVSLPLVPGVAGGDSAYFVVLETSDSVAARERRVTFVPRLAELRGSSAVQRGRWEGGYLVVDAGVDFSPQRRVERGATDAFPPARAEPGSVGRPGYSPYVEFADGSVWNIALVADARQEHDRVMTVMRNARYVVLRITRGYGSGKTLRYVSTEASDPMVAALEGATFVPALASLSEGEGSAQLMAMVNGPLAAEDVAERHGMRSAVAGEGDPLNILAAIPGEPVYAPLWDLHMAMWSPRAVRDGLRERLLGLNEVTSRASSGLVQWMDGARQPSRTGALVNCPVVAVRD